ncbi:HWE histidine kinase domain-containing protein [Aurantiacibacter rhizosphaerae]|uniref:histidine kinase n=1 Tax=Aurantiacibacter rhizosphaerae TaxID=2691582 RepID=A0A844XER5_9SPHN|nr:HWE histidine kinase domain-containing protein [Aurantiacibacter rhizosphaerae]MWV28243.1 GAF domain-containing protein [Aurantiacibacter rhizosphaerae]
MKVDLTNCDREEIHLLGHVQTFGCLLAFSSDWLIVHASCNTDEILGVKAEEIIGTSALDVITESALHDIRGAVQTLNAMDATAHLFDVRVRANDDRRFNIALHRTGRNTIVEIEPALSQEKQKDSMSQVRNIIDRLNGVDDVDKLCKIAARFVGLLTGFDRVMVYRFAPDLSGQVIAEAANPGIDSFMGLRYPASDIPSQARELYRRSLIRIISDVNDKVSPIIPEANSENEKVDLSLSTLRAVSPIHLEYLRNMGVEASMSISIMVNGKLWGLFACHHYKPLVLDARVRSACDLFGQMFGYVLAALENRRKSNDMEAVRNLHDDLMRHFAEGAKVEDDVDFILEGLDEIVDFDGAVSWIDGKFRQVGNTPTKDEIMTLVRFLNTTATSQVYSTNCLHKVHPPAEDYIARGAGLLALPVSRKPRDYIMLFRGEVAKTVTWAGNPEKAIEYGPNGARLTPRKSFASWKETVYGQSEDWTAKEKEIAERIRVTLLEVVLLMSDAANAERTRAQEKQELLIAELNHRVRNILNLIRGLVEQSKTDAVSVDEFTTNVSDRIQALARAHDQITRGNWSAASLRELIRTEVTAYLGPKCDRVQFSGCDAIVLPETYSTLALVIHELASNSAKYGALADSRGKIDVTLTREDDDALTLTWVESDGPTVKPPTRRGFGSTVIERSIPFELGGEAEISFPMSGVRARLMIPEAHIEDFVEQEQSEPEKVGTPVPAKTSSSQLSGTVLLVEDNMIIAMDSEKMLEDLGAQKVCTASSVAEAMRIIEEEDISMALLDLNLGVDNSLPVARTLKEKGIPFAFATGYGDSAQLLEDFSEYPVLTKPYEKALLGSTMAGLL